MMGQKEYKIGHELISKLVGEYMSAFIFQGMWDLSLPTKDQICISWIARRIAYHWDTREALNQYQTKYLKGHCDKRIIPTTPLCHQRCSNPNPWKLHTRSNVPPGYMTLHSKRNLAGVIQLRALQWKVTQDYLSRPDAVTAGRPRSQWCGRRKTQPANPSF